MSAQTLSCLAGLKKLAKARTSQKRKQILETFGTEIIKAICECIINVLQENVKLSEHELKKLRRHRNLLRLLSDKKATSLKSKKKIIIQKGGAFLPVLLPPVISILAELITNKIF